jgi:polysaccharide deacetylase 2 family uncharacterized protein YibQ
MMQRLKASKVLLWRLAAVILSLVCIGLLATLWASGEKDTQDAFNTGRRLLIKVTDGTVEGKLLSALPPEPKPEELKPVEPKPEESSVVEPSVTPETPPPPAEPAPITPETEIPPPTTPPEPTAPEAAAPSEPVMPEPAAAPAAETAKPAELEINQQVEEPDMTQAAAEEAPTIIPSDHPLPDTNPKLVEKAEAGELPIIGADGTKPWNYYAKPFTRKGSQPMIAIIITGIGQNKKVAEKAMALPENFTLSLSPYAKNVGSWASSARLTAHEKLIDLPMEPSNYPASDPGPHGLVINKGLKENELRLQWALARFTGHLGVVTPQNEVFTANNEAFRVVLQSLSNRGLLVVMGREPAKTDTKDMIESSNTAYVIADMLIDEEFTAPSIQTRLVALEQLAKKRGYAVGIAQATPLTIEQLRTWSERLAEKGIVLVPVSAVAKLRFS